MEAASRRETIRAGYNRHHSQVPDVEKYFIEGLLPFNTSFTSSFSPE